MLDKQQVGPPWVGRQDSQLEMDSMLTLCFRLAVLKEEKYGG